MTELANLKPRLMVLETITALPDQPVNRAAIAETATEALRLIESQAAEIARLREAGADVWDSVATLLRMGTPADAVATIAAQNAAALRAKS